LIFENRSVAYIEIGEQRIAEKFMTDIVEILTGSQEKLAFHNSCWYKSEVLSVAQDFMSCIF